MSGDVQVTVTAPEDNSKSYVKAKNTQTKNSYVMYFDKSSTYPKEIHCEADSNDSIANKVCLSVATDPSKTATATESGYTAYVIEGDGGETGNSTNTGCGNDCWGDTQIPNGVMNYLYDYAAGKDVIVAPLDGRGWYGISADDTFFYNPQLNVLALDDYAYFYNSNGNRIGEAQCYGGSYLAHDGNCSSWGECSGECPTLNSL